MRVIDENGKTITAYDLSKGFLAPTVAIREDASPIDNITKFAWKDEDYEKVNMFVLNPIKEMPQGKPIEERLDKLEKLMSNFVTWEDIKKWKLLQK